jgi:hypothetical protein
MSKEDEKKPKARRGDKGPGAEPASKHEMGSHYMKAGLKRLELLKQIGQTVERLSLLGSYWKQLAQVHHARGELEDIQSDLVGVAAAYWEAAEHGRQSSGECDYYPLFNALDADFLIAARGERSRFKERAAQLSALLREGIDNARRRFSDDREFFHALAELEADRIDALWACYDGRADACMTQPDVVERLIARYCDVLKRLGSVSEHESVVNQLRFLMDMLPAGDEPNTIREALRRLGAGIGKCVAG